jgi:hypothetical protein
LDLQLPRPDSYRRYAEVFLMPRSDGAAAGQVWEIKKNPNL